jgi:hypothetical protein
MTTRRIADDVKVVSLDYPVAKQQVAEYGRKMNRGQNGQFLCFIGGQYSARAAGRADARLSGDLRCLQGGSGRIWQNGNFGGKLAVARIYIDCNRSSLDEVEQLTGLTVRAYDCSLGRHLERLSV